VAVMDQRKPLTREQLHEIAMRRRGDEDVRTLLLEIKRLHELVVQAYQRGSRALGYTEDPNEAQIRERFGELFENQPAILESEQPPRMAVLGPERRWPHMSEEREAKLLARTRRG
jgi:hypothetical protein